MESHKISSINLNETTTSHLNRPIVNEDKSIVIHNDSLNGDILSLYTDFYQIGSLKSQLVNPFEFQDVLEDITQDDGNSTIISLPILETGEPGQLAIYILKDLQAVNKGYKVGRITGTKEILRQNYIRSIPYPKYYILDQLHSP